MKLVQKNNLLLVKESEISDPKFNGVNTVILPLSETQVKMKG